MVGERVNMTRDERKCDSLGLMTCNPATEIVMCEPQDFMELRLDQVDVFWIKFQGIICF